MALYDPNEFPETETVADFTLADVLAWARTKPADEAYDYSDPWDCALCRFLTDVGIASAPSVRPHLTEPRPTILGLGTWQDGTGPRYPYPAKVEPALREMPWTFGAFAKRLESALA